MVIPRVSVMAVEIHPEAVRDIIMDMATVPVLAGVRETQPEVRSMKVLEPTQDDTERTGHGLSYQKGYGSGNGDGFGDCNGSGNGYGCGDGWGYGDGTVWGYGSGRGDRGTYENS